MRRRESEFAAILPRTRIMRGKVIALGPGKVELLAQLQQTHSITSAARNMGMSYMRAWMLIRTMNQSFREPLVESLRGGKTGGGARLTAAGRKALQLYRAMDTQYRKSVQSLSSELCGMLAPEKARSSRHGKK
jgi:molybdate transport system regulatory protein